MKQFEYKLVDISKLEGNFHTNLDIHYLNSLGKEGWELVEVVRSQAVFKREITA